MELREWLKEGLDRSGLTRYAVAARADISESYLSRMLEGGVKRPGYEKLLSLAKTLAAHCSNDPEEQIRFINSGLAIAKYEPLPMPGDEAVFSPIARAEVNRIMTSVERLRDSLHLRDALTAAAQLGTIAPDKGLVKGSVPAAQEPEDREPMSGDDGEEFLALIGGDFYLRVSRDSMQPYYSDGAWIVVKATPDPPLGSVVIATVEGRSICKRYVGAHVVDGETVYTLEPTNAKYRSISAREVVFQGVVLGQYISSGSREENHQLREENEDLRRQLREARGEV